MARVDWFSTPSPRAARVIDAILALREARCAEELFSKALGSLDKILSFDSAAGIFRPDRSVLSAVGISERSVRRYNEYYRGIQPPFAFERRPGRLERLSSSLKIYSYSSYANTEFYTDYARPNRLEHVLRAPSIGREVFLTVSRSRRSQEFAQRDHDVLDILSTHLAVHHARLRRETEDSGQPCARTLGELFPRLSRREAEIASFLCRRMTSIEIAALLFISPRTVEMHVGHLYAKLGVDSRRRAIALLTSTKPFLSS